MANNWIQKVDKEMEKKGTVGAFTKQAKRHGMSVHDFAMEVKRNPEDYSSTTRKRANLALTFERIGKRRRERDEAKMARGGKTQGYDDKQNESLGMRRGKQSSKKVSAKGRRDDSYGKWGKRDEEGRKISMAHGGKTQGYDDKQNESLGMRRGKQSTKKVSAKGRRDDSYGKWGKRDEEGRDITMARGGSVKGKIDRDRYTKLRREKDKTISKLRKEKGSLKKDLREKGADCAEDIKTMKKDIGKTVAKRIDQVEKRKDKECERLADVETKGDGNQTLLLSGIAGIFLGAFLGRR